jgi:hypothetical protein
MKYVIVYLNTSNEFDRTNRLSVSQMREIAGSDVVIGVGRDMAAVVYPREAAQDTVTLMWATPDTPDTATHLTV